MRIEPPGHGHAWVKGFPTVFSITRDAEFKASFNKLDIRSFTEGVVHNRFVFVDGDRTGRIDQITSGFRVWCHAVNGAKDELLLEMRQQSEVALRLISNVPK